MASQPQAKKNLASNETTTQRLKHYIKAGTSDNTRTAYQADVRSFQEWGGLLPASTQTICHYLVAHAQKLSTSTLTRRLAGLSAWHIAQDFSDPTQSVLVKKTMRGIRRQHNIPKRKARPLELESLKTIVSYLDEVIVRLSQEGLVSVKDHTTWLKAHRDKAMILVGFWRGLRADSLCVLQRVGVERVEAHTLGRAVQTLSIYLPHSKGDREAHGETLILPPLGTEATCPVTSLQRWLDISPHCKNAAMFPRFDRQGQLTEKPLAASSLGHWLKRLCKNAGVSHPESYSSHSLRRGLANYMVHQGADTRTLMDYIGWKSPTTAQGYIQRGQGGFDLLACTSHRFTPNEVIV